MTSLETTPSSSPNPLWRWIALAFWALIALAFLAFFLTDLRLDYNQILTPCQGTECNWMAISSAEVEVLHSWDLSTQTYAIFMTAAATLTVAIYWLLGGLLIWRLGATRIGLSVSMILLVIPISLISDSSNVYLNIPGLLIPWVFLSALGRVFMLLFIYLFPNGRFYPRWAFIPLAVAIIITVVSSILEIIGIHPLSTIQIPLLLSTLAMGILGCFFQIMRYRQSSTPIERQQTKWVLFGLIILMLAFPVWIFFFGGFPIPAGVPRLLGSVFGWLLNSLLVTALPIALTIAILRYRLWNIDLIIRRTLIYGALTIMLLAIYFALVILLQNLLVAVGGQQSPVIIVLSTLFIAALFNPLRVRIQNFIDRRFYRQKYDAEQALAAFGQTVREEVDLENLSTALLGVVEETMRPESVSVWLKELPKTKEDLVLGLKK